MAPQNENRLETVRFRTTVKAKADFKAACLKMGFEMSEALEEYIKSFSRQAGVL